MNKHRCQGVLIENDMSQGDIDAFVCVWCGTTYDRRPGINADDRCRAMFELLPQTQNFGNSMNQVRATGTARGERAEVARPGR